MQASRLMQIPFLDKIVKFAALVGFSIGGLAYYLVAAILLLATYGSSAIVLVLFMGIPVFYGIYKMLELKKFVDRLG